MTYSREKSHTFSILLYLRDLGAVSPSFSIEKGRGGGFTPKFWRENKGGGEVKGGEIFSPRDTQTHRNNNNSNKEARFVAAKMAKSPTGQKKTSDGVRCLYRKTAPGNFD